VGQHTCRRCAWPRSFLLPRSHALPAWYTLLHARYHYTPALRAHARRAHTAHSISWHAPTPCPAPSCTARSRFAPPHHTCHATPRARRWRTRARAAAPCCRAPVPTVRAPPAGVARSLPLNTPSASLRAALLFNLLAPLVTTRALSASRLNAVTSAGARVLRNNIGGLYHLVVLSRHFHIALRPAPYAHFCIATFLTSISFLIGTFAFHDATKRAGAGG